MSFPTFSFRRLGHVLEYGLSLQESWVFHTLLHTGQKKEVRIHIVATYCDRLVHGSMSLRTTGRYDSGALESSTEGLNPDKASNSKPDQVNCRFGWMEYGQQSEQISGHFVQVEESEKLSVVQQNQGTLGPRSLSYIRLGPCLHMEMQSCTGCS